MIGTSLDKYEVLQKVGEGGMATVYRGRHSTLDRDVAIKVLHPHLSSSLRNRKRFAREAKAIEHLRHPNILEIFDYSGIEASDCYIVTEFVHGETLTHLLMRRGRVVSEVTAMIGIALSRALAYAHAEGVLHRDIKTDNVMMRVDGTVKLMDFGIARFLDESQVTMTGALVGSPAFMSPEQAREEPLDQRSDLFALGTVLFYLVTGDLPFAGSNPSLVLKNVIEGNRPSVSEVAPKMSATLAGTIERLLATSPSDRFVSAADVERELAAGLAEVHVDPASPEWSLVRYIADPDAYEQRLDRHLREVLLSEGRLRLAAHDHLGALRLFNRLLSIDEDNADVLKLIQSLHGEAARGSAARNRWLAGGALGILALTGLVLALATSREVAPSVVLAERDPMPVPLLPPPDRVVPPPDPAPPPQEDRGPLPTRIEQRSADRPTSRSGTSPTVESRVDRSVPGKVFINTGDAPVKIYEKQGTYLGESRSEMELPAGTYDLVLKNPYFEVEEIQITVISGETVPHRIVMRPKPAALHFTDDVPADCVVAVAGDRKGTVGTLEGRTWIERRPDLRGVVPVTLVCGDDVHELDWNVLRGLTQNFPFATEP